MPKVIDLHKVTFDSLTEACPKSRRRFKTGAAAEVMAWLVLMHNRVLEQLTNLPREADGAAGAWLSGMRRALELRAEVLAALIADAESTFNGHEWNHAVAFCAGVLKSPLPSWPGGESATGEGGVEGEGEANAP